MTRPIKINNEEFVELPKEAVLASKWIVDIWVKLGKPQTPFTKSGSKLMNVIIAVWQDLYPLQVKEWTEERATYKKEELLITEQVHRQTGRSLASYPMPIFQMMKKVFPKFKVGDRSNTLKLVRKWSMFQFCQKI